MNQPAPVSAPRACRSCGQVLELCPSCSHPGICSCGVAPRLPRCACPAASGIPAQARPENDRSRPRSMKVAVVYRVAGDPPNACRARGSTGDVYRVWLDREPSEEWPACTCPGGRRGLKCYHLESALARFGAMPPVPAPELAGYALTSSSGVSQTVTVTLSCPPILCARCSGAPAQEPAKPRAKVSDLYDE